MKLINTFTNLFTATMCVGISLLYTLTVDYEIMYELLIIVCSALIGALVYYLASRYEKRLENELFG